MKKFNKYDNIRVKYKIWIANEDGSNILGEGKLFLLENIKDLGSISAAARQTGISYRKAWGDLKAAEQLLGFQLIEKVRGGSKGGETKLTNEGQELLDAYNEMKSEFQMVVNEVIKKFKRKVKKADPKGKQAPPN